LFGSSRSAPRIGREDDHTEEGTTDQEHSIPSLPGQQQQQQQQNQFNAHQSHGSQRRRTASQGSQQQQPNDESSEDRTPPIRNGDEDSDTSSYPSVGMNVVSSGSHQASSSHPQPTNNQANSRGRDPTINTGNNRGSGRDPAAFSSADIRRGNSTGRLSRKNSAGYVRDNDKLQQHKRQQQSSTSGGQQKEKRPQKKQPPKQQHRRNNSSSNINNSNATVATMKTTQSDKTYGTFKSNQSSAENAAMQQLAMLVVTLRSDMERLQKEKEGMKEKLKSIHSSSSSGKRRPPPQQQQQLNGAHDNSTTTALLEEYKQENIELKADIDAFLLENDALSREISELKIDKEAAEDLISRLKADSLNASSLSMDRLGSTGGANNNNVNKTTQLENKNAALEERLKELTDENHKLEGELRLMVDEKQEMMKSHSNTVSDVALKEREVEQLNLALKDLAEQLLVAQKDAQQRAVDEEKSNKELEKLRSALKEAEMKLERQLEGEKTFLLLVDQHEEKMREAQCEKEEQVKLVKRLREDIADLGIVKDDLKEELKDSNAYILELESELEKKKGMSKEDLERYVIIRCMAFVCE
jgi:hypothetical protein